MNSREFLETVFKELQNMWSDQISEVIDYIRTIRNDIPYFRLFEAIVDVRMLVIDLELFVYCLQDRITCLYESTSTSNWDFIHSYAPASSCFRWISRKSIVSNMSLDPIIMEEDTKLNILSSPIHMPLRGLRALNISMPELVMYLGKTFMPLRIYNCYLYKYIRYFS